MHAQGIGRSREELQSAKTYVSEAYAAHQSLGNHFDLAWDLHVLGLAELKLGDHASAAARWRESLAMFVAAGDTSGIVIMLSNFGALAETEGDIERRATLVGAWTAIVARTGVGLADTIQREEQRTVAADVAPQQRPALERGLAMTTEEAVAYALDPETAKPA